MRWLLPGFQFLGSLGCGASDNPSSAESRIAEADAVKEGKSQESETKAPKELLDLALRVCEIDSKRCGPQTWGYLRQGPGEIIEIEAYAGFEVIKTEHLGASPADRLNGIDDRWTINTSFAGRGANGKWYDHSGCLQAIQKNGAWVIEEYSIFDDHRLGPHVMLEC